MKTQEELERMSDHELNLALHFIIDESFKSTYRLAWNKTLWVSSVLPRYCSSPNDIMPLVFNHRLRLIPFYADWYQVDCYESVVGIALEANHKNPYRAATIVLILLLQGEEDDDR